MDNNDMLYKDRCHGAWGEGKVALVTGAAKRVGRLIALALHSKGFNIVVHCNKSRWEAEDLVQRFNCTRPNSGYVVAGDLNLFVKATCGRIVSEAESRWGRLDLLINNASQYYATPLDTTTEEQYDCLMDTNTKAPYFLTQASSPHLKKTKGCVVNLGDIIGEQPSLPMSVYGISKAALIMQSKALAIELGPEVRVNWISPGVVVWPEVELDLHNEAFKQTWISKTPLAKEGSAEDVAEAVLFLASPAAAYMTGSGITLDGGRALRL